MISIVVPLYNEEESLPHFYKELTKYIKNLTKNYEIIFVDDGSNDGSLKFLQNLAKKDKKISIFSFRKNLGKAEALSFGFAQAQGEYIVTLDADLQDKPSEIEKLLKKAKQGWDLVSGWRKYRQDSKAKIIASKFFNSIASKLFGLSLHDYNCGLKVYRQQAAKSLNIYGGLHRFIPLIVFQEGFLVTEVPVEHSKRKYGKSKYSISKLWKDLPDIFTMVFLTKYSNRPLHFFGLFGSLLLFLGMVILLYLTILHFLGQGIGNRPLLFLGMLLVLGGFQVFFTGFLADLMINLVKEKSRVFPLKFSIQAPKSKNKKKEKYKIDV